MGSAMIRFSAQGPVARSLVSANRWLRGIKLYRFPWYLTLVSTNHASRNPGQGACLIFGTSREGAHLGQGAYVLFQKQPNAQNKTLRRNPFTRDLPYIASILFTRVKFTRDCFALYKGSV